MIVDKERAIMSINVQYVNPFIQATQSVLEMVCQVKPTLGSLYVKESPFSGENVAIILGVVGDIKGQVIFTMKTDTGCYIASKMMMGMPVAELDEMAKSAISELTNMILGNTATLFFNNGMSIDITPPSLLMGDNMQISTVKTKAICIPLQFEEHTMEIEIAIQEK